MTAMVCVVAVALSLGTAPIDDQARVDLSQRYGDIDVVVSPDGYRLTVPTSTGRVEMSPDQFARQLLSARQEQRRHGFLFVLFNITSWTGVLWVALGLGGQLAFTARMLVQWLSSERARRSVVPVSFWWMSLVGASMLILYFVWRKDVVGVIGQSTGWIIYIRNLRLVYRHRPEPTIADDPGPEPELAE